jgi:predicted site-specific integrase-resolvase
VLDKTVHILYLKWICKNETYSCYGSNHGNGKPTTQKGLDGKERGLKKHLQLLGKQLKKAIRQQDEDRKTPFSFLERAARKEVRRIEEIDEEELGLGNLETEGLEIITAIEGNTVNKYLNKTRYKK